MILYKRFVENVMSSNKSRRTYNKAMLISIPGYPIYLVVSISSTA